MRLCSSAYVRPFWTARTCNQALPRARLGGRRVVLKARTASASLTFDAKKHRLAFYVVRPKGFNREPTIERSDRCKWCPHCGGGLERILGANRHVPSRDVVFGVAR
jgi:hypothetical protein